MMWGRFSGSNHNDDKSSDGKLSGVDAVTVISDGMNAVMVNEVGFTQLQ